MKIEIEYSEVEALKRELAASLEQVANLQAQLAALDAKTLKKQAVDLSWMLFDNYMECIFRHLGFDQTGQWPHGSVSVNHDLEHWLGKSWWNSERLTVDIGANVSTRFRQAFLSMGIITKEEE